MTLHERAASDVRPSRCFTCSLPGALRAEIDEILRDPQGLTKAAVIRTLKNDGHAATRNRLNYHAQEGHHLLSPPKERKAHAGRRARMH